MSLYTIPITSIDGNEQTLAPFQGKVLLIVNVASKCGFTPQYTGLEALYRKYRERGFEVLGFPCDQFGHQEPGTEAEIQQFCSLNYEVSFPLFAKIEVNGANAHPLYRFLKKAQPGLLGTEAIKWNFTKFLVDQHGTVRQRFAPTDKPEDIDADIAALLNWAIVNKVIDNPEHRRYELQTDAGLAFINYRRAGNVVSMTHAEVPPVLQGRGIGSELVKGALELVRAQQEKVVPICPFVAIYIQRHKEFQGLLLEGA